LIAQWQRGIPLEWTNKAVLKQGAAGKGSKAFSDALLRENAQDQAYRLEQAVVGAAMFQCTMVETPDQADNYSKGIGEKVAAARGLDPRARESALGLTLLNIYENLSTKSFHSKANDFSRSAQGMRKAAEALVEGYASSSASAEYKLEVGKRILDENQEPDKPISSSLTAAMGEKYPELLRQSADPLLHKSMTD